MSEAPGPDRGIDRARRRQRTRRRWAGGLAAAMIALVFALHFGAMTYARMGGAMPAGRFPMWIPVAFWVAAIVVALVGMVAAWRAADEYERRVLAEAGAGTGIVLILSMPPAIALGAGPSLLIWMGLLWLIAVLTGLAIVAFRRGTT